MRYEYHVVGYDPGAGLKRSLNIWANAGWEWVPTDYEKLGCLVFRRSD